MFTHRIDDIVNIVTRNYPDANIELVHRAYVYAAKMHKGQVRKSGEPYLSHPIETAFVLANMKMDDVTIAAALLHDVLEDTEATHAELAEMFGEEVARLVDGVTKVSKIHFASNEEYQAENLRKMLMAMTNDIRVILIKLADRLHNVRTLNFAPEEQQKRVAKETVEIFAPLANRLGLGLMKTELEDEALQYLDPDVYNQLINYLNEIQKEHQQTVDVIREELQKRLQEHNIEAEITSRQKHLYSLYRKMKRNNVSCKEVLDVIGLRVITNSKADCYLTLGTIHSTWTHIPNTFDDYITLPKPNMYQSLHTAVMGPFSRPVEIQIRTWEMHHIAEEGIAAHWRYKEGKAKDDEYDQQFFGLRHLLEMHREGELARPGEFMENVKMDFSREEVYVFTPQGHIKCLPQGATPVDFAYAVHSEIGDQCVGAKVNDRIVPLRTTLRHGDIITIITQKNHQPSKDWLNFVVTPKARAKIKHYFKIKKREEEIQFGMKMLEKALRRLDIKISNAQKEAALKSAVAELGMPSEEDLFVNIATHKYHLRQVLEKMFPHDKTLGEQKPEEKPAQTEKETSGKAGTAIKVSGASNVLTRFGNCCNPLPGDEIVGFITRGRGVTIHAKNCPNIKALEFDDDRKIEVEWERAPEVFYSTELFIIGEPRDSLLSEISGIIAKTNASIVNSRSENIGTQSEFYFTVKVLDREHLETVIRNVRGLKAVQNVIPQRALR